MREVVSLLIPILLTIAPQISGATLGELREQVRRTETAFAKTMADRDHEAFRTFLAEDVVFLSGKTALRGRDAVAGAWKELFEKPGAPFSWEPETVEVIASGDLAISTGPVFGPAGTRIGTFHSTWRREPDGSWKIVLDSGCPPCECGAGNGD